MDISLNISSNVTNKPSFIKSNDFKSSKKTKSSSSSNGGFSFQFTNKAKVKAIVARKRVVPQKNQGSFVKAPAAVSPPRRNFVMRPPSDSEDEDPVAREAPFDTQLSLNISTSKGNSQVPDKKKKLSKAERLQAKNIQKKGLPTDKVLTNDELNEGIKKFSRPAKPQKKILPSKKSDLFVNNPETKIIGQRLVKPVTEQIFTGAPMESIGLHPHSVKNLADLLNITELTTVQQKTIPRALEGRDILARSQTGSGKTLAYALPIVEKLQEIRPKLTRDCGVQAVVIVPTRELAIQTYELFLKLLKPFTWIVAGYLTGGEKRKAEKARLRKGINILIGTPGRLCDHLLHTESFRLESAKWLVLDEADRLLEMGYERDVKKIVEAINDHISGGGKVKSKNPFKSNEDEGNKDEPSDLKPDKKIILQKNPFKSEEKEESNDVKSGKEINLQRMLLSATLTPAVQKLAGLTLNDPLFIDTSDADVSEIVKSGGAYETAVSDAVQDERLVIPATVDLSYILIPPKLRLVTLSGLLAKEYAKKKLKALVFMSTMEMVNFHHDLLTETLTQKILDEEDEEKSDDDDDGDDPLLMGVRFFKLHGSMTQQERSGVFQAFRATKCGVLLATDVVGRGIDVPEVDLVVQYSPPQKISDFVHRVGRTARAGRSGRAVLFLGPGDTDFVRILEDKRIRISQGAMENCLNALNEADTSARNVQEAASNLQHKFEELIKEDKEMHDKAAKAFVSWVRFYSTFPKELKHIFNARNTHMGHYAKSFGLREPPTSFVKKHTTPKPLPPTNRLTYTERNPEKIQKEKEVKKRRLTTTVTAAPINKLNKFLPKSISLSTSEYDSGLAPLKKRKTG